MGWFTADNATNNDTALKALGKAIDPNKIHWDPVSRRIRSVLLNLVAFETSTNCHSGCMEHSLNLAAHHFVEGVSPTPIHKLIQKVHGALVAAGDGGDIDLDALDQEMAAVESDGEDDGDEVEDFDVGDVVGKALALVNQVGTAVHITTD